MLPVRPAVAAQSVLSSIIVQVDLQSEILPLHVELGPQQVQHGSSLVVDRLHRYSVELD